MLQFAGLAQHFHALTPVLKGRGFRLSADESRLMSHGHTHFAVPSKTSGFIAGGAQLSFNSEVGLISAFFLDAAVVVLATVTRLCLGCVARQHCHLRQHHHHY